MADLSADTPMDRLLAADVGFGKTEVAMRAACVVALSGAQTAVLAPTTLLAEQHVRNFKDPLCQLPGARGGADQNEHGERKKYIIARTCRR